MGEGIFHDIASAYVEVECHKNGRCISQVEERTVLMWVKIPSDHLTFCFHWLSIRLNFQKSPGESVVIKNCFTVACAFITNCCCLQL